MPYRRVFYTLSVLAVVSALSACSLIYHDIHLTGASMVTAVDDNLMPVRITDTFPSGTSKVSCWIKWRDARINTQITASWHYLTDDIHILDYPFSIPKKEGSGGLALSMPDGKNLPKGSYKVDLLAGGRLLRSLKFTVE
jgi:hypothetical protein